MRMCLNKLFQILGSWYRPLSLTWVFPESDSLGVDTVLRFDNSRFPDTNSMPCSPHTKWYNDCPGFYTGLQSVRKSNNYNLCIDSCDFSGAEWNVWLYPHCICTSKAKPNSKRSNPSHSISILCFVLSCNL